MAYFSIPGKNVSFLIRNKITRGEIHQKVLDYFDATRGGHLTSLQTLNANALSPQEIEKYKGSHFWGHIILPHIFLVKLENIFPTIFLGMKIKNIYIWNHLFRNGIYYQIYQLSGLLDLIKETMLTVESFTGSLLHAFLKHPLSFYSMNFCVFGGVDHIFHRCFRDAIFLMVTLSGRFETTFWLFEGFDWSHCPNFDTPKTPQNNPCSWEPAIA